MPVINLTPHVVTLIPQGGETIPLPPSGTVARLESRRERAGAVMCGGRNVSVHIVRLGKVTGLPTPQPGVSYLVSRLVADTVGRPDLLVPDLIERDPEGKIVGAAGLAMANSAAIPKHSEPVCTCQRDTASHNGATGAFIDAHALEAAESSRRIGRRAFLRLRWK